ncbi:hypothetical protein Tco_0044830 [Tanacetum coccineum]
MYLPRFTKQSFTTLPYSRKFVSAKRSPQIYGAILPKCLTSPAMKESKAYKTYLGYATGAVPPKMARKFKKASPSKKDSDLVPIDEEPVQKGKRSKSKERKRWMLLSGKEIELLSEVVLTKEAQMKELETTTNEDGTSTTTIPGAVTAEQKILKKNDLKARSILMMTLPSHSSTNDVNTANVHVSIGSTPVSTASM